MSEEGMSVAHLARRRWKSVALITAVAVVCYGGLRQLGKAGEALSHSDFRADGMFSPEYCDPGEPKFIPVERVRGAVAVELKAEPALAVGQSSRLELAVRTASGRPIRPEDLLLKHTRLVHLLVVDEAAEDYQHLHPEPLEGGQDGRWTTTYTPTGPGKRRFFVEFTPKATARGLYGLAEAEVAGAGTVARQIAGPASWSSEVAGLRFSLKASTPVLFAGKRSRVTLEVTAPEGVSLELAPVMGAWMHLVAFDSGAQGFVHLHPAGTDPLSGNTLVAGSTAPSNFEFDLELPKPGLYRLWAQAARANNAELFAPFTIEVR